MKTTDHLEENLRHKNLRVTSARKVIFEILQNSDRALSPKEVCEFLKRTTKLQADTASVYRNLTLFSEIGLTHRLQSGKYTLCQHGEDHSHHTGHEHMHIVATCTSCGKTQEVPSHDRNLCNLAGGFKTYIEGFSTFTGITLAGYCEACSKN